MDKRIIVSVVCYNNEDEIVYFAGQLMQQKDKEKLLLVVTCCSCNNVCLLEERLQAIGIDIIVCNPGKNLGYLNGALYGLEQCNGTIDYDWATISNTDIFFLQRDFFSTFSAKRYGSDVWCVGPDVISKYEKHINPYLPIRVAKVKLLVNQIVAKSVMLRMVYRLLHRIKEFFVSNFRNRESRYVYGVNGCLFFLRRECIDLLRYDASKIFMYCEENLIAEIILKSGHKEFFDRDMRLVHEESAVTKMVENEQKIKWMLDSVTYLLERFYAAD